MFFGTTAANIVELQILHAVSQQLLLTVSLTVEVNGQRAEQQGRTGDILPVLGHACHVQTGVECLNQNHAQRHAGDGADAAHHGYTGQIAGGDGVEVQVGAGGRLTGEHPGGQNNTSHSREHGSHHIADDLDAVGVDACQPGSLRIAADGKNAAAKLGAGQDKSEDRKQENGHDNRIRNAAEYHAVAKALQSRVADGDGAINQDGYFCINDVRIPGVDTGLYYPNNMDQFQRAGKKVESIRIEHKERLNVESGRIKEGVVLEFNLVPRLGRSNYSSKDFVFLNADNLKILTEEQAQQLNNNPKSRISEL